MWHIEVAGRAALAALGQISPAESIGVPPGAQHPSALRAIVRASFERSCYVESQSGHLLCVGNPSIGRGPLNALVRQFVAPPVGATVSMDATNSLVWQPGSRMGQWTAASGQRLHQAALGRVPLDGLGGLITGSSSPLIKHAEPALRALNTWLGESRQTDWAPAPVKNLIGLGHGLTPSGDDYLCGVLVALHGMGQSQKAQALWKEIEPCLATQTNFISAAHLQAAAQGEGHEALHTCLVAVTAGQTIRPDDLTGPRGPLTQLAQIGHSSGWDALAGAVAALKAGCYAPPLQRTSF